MAFAIALVTPLASAGRITLYWPDERDAVPPFVVLSDPFTFGAFAELNRLGVDTANAIASALDRAPVLTVTPDEWTRWERRQTRDFDELEAES